MTLSVYQATVTNASGDILPSADIEVILESTGLPATIYSTRAGAALANPFTSDANGFAQFYADAGEYKITATSGILSRVWRYVRLGDGGSQDISIGTDFDQVPLNSDLQRPAKYQLEFEGVSSAVAALAAAPDDYPNNSGVNTLSYRTKAECTALSIPYPDGGGANYIVGTGYVIDEIGSGFTAGTKQLVINLQGAALWEQWGAAGNNGADIPTAIDDTASMQALLNTEFNIESLNRGKVYLTSNTLFNQRSNRSIDFKGSTLRNRSNNRYSIVSIPGTLATLTDAALNIYMDENHYGEELTNVSIKNLIVKMNPKAGGGANLGIGMVYCLNSSYEHISITGTNGNAIEMRQSENCTFSFITSSEYRTYGIFLFQCENCTVSDFKMASGVRAVVIKQGRNGRGTTNNVIRDGHILNQSDTYWVSGGSNFVVGGGALYPVGHEVTGEVLVENILMEETDGLKAPGFNIGNFAYKWTLRNITFKSNNGVVGNNISVGVQGDYALGGVVGGDHLIESCKFLGVNSIGNAVISYAVNHKVKNCVFEGSFDLIWLATTSGPTTLRDEAKFEDNKVNGNIAMYADIARMGLVCTPAAGWVSTVVKDNEMDITPITGTGTTIAAMYIGSDRSNIKSNNIHISYNAASTTIFGINVTGNSFIDDNQVILDVGGSVATRHISLLGTTKQYALGNLIEQVGTSSGSTSGVRYQASTGQTDNNMFIGSLTNTEATY